MTSREKYKPKPIPKKDRLLVLKKYDNRCGYCGKSIDIKTMQVDHLTPIYRDCSDLELSHRRLVRGTNELNNLMPACKNCNHYKRDYTLENFRRLIKTLHERINKHYINKVAKNFGIITSVQPFDGKFYFEKL